MSEEIIICSCGKPKILLCLEGEVIEAIKKTVVIDIKSNVERLLNLVGTKTECKGCGADMWWVKHEKTGKTAPYNSEALNHFADCPKAGRFKK